MAFPPAHILVAAAVAEVVREPLGLTRWRAWGVAAGLALLPDCDLVLDLVLRRAHTYHGTFTHSLAATLAIALLARYAAGPRWSALAAAGYGSHLLVDLLDDRGRTNVLLAWPFSEARPFAVARLFPTVPFEHGHGVSVALLSLLRPPVFLRLVEQTLVAAAVVAGVLLALRLLPRSRRAGL